MATAPRDINEILGGNDIFEAKAKAAEAVAAAEEELRAIQAGLIAGNLSGLDPERPWLDGVVAIYGQELLEDSEVLSRYQETVDRLQASRPWDPVLIVKRWVKRINYDGPGSQWLSPSINTSYSMGLLVDKELAFDVPGQSCYLPTGRHTSPPVKFSSHGSVNAVSANGGLLIDSKPDWTRVIEQYRLGYDLEHLEKTQPEEPFCAEQFIAMEILMGRDEISAWVNEPNYSVMGDREHSQSRIKDLGHKLGLELEL